jgi:hypothetical protein
LTGQDATDAHIRPSDRAAIRIRRRSREEGAKAGTGEIDDEPDEKRHCQH